MSSLIPHAILRSLAINSPLGLIAVFLLCGAGPTPSGGAGPWTRLGAPAHLAHERPIDPNWEHLGAPSNRSLAPPGDPALEAKIDHILAGMSRYQKVGQLLFVGFGGTEVDPGGAIEHLVKGKQVGGMALFSRNVKSIPQIARFTRQLRGLVPTIPPFIAVDQEGGNVVRLREPTTVLPSNMALGAANMLGLTRRAASSLGHDLWLLGFNMNLAPVLDVNSNPHNPVIGIRSFGENPYQVGLQGGAYVQGLQGAGIAAVAKHFPGHGDTNSDSHYGMPSLPHDRARLLSVELVPFQHAVEAGLDAVMTAHIALPAVEGRPGIPATISHKVLTGLLRETLGFHGVIITDGMEMKGIVDAFGSGPAAVRAIQAGADMVLILWTKEKKEEVHHALLSAVADGRISAKRLDASVRRILRVKLRRGLFDRPPPGLAEGLAQLGNGHRGRKIAQEVSERSLTLVRNKAGLTPIDLHRYRRVLLLSSDRSLTLELGKRLPGLRSVRTPSIPSRRRRARDTQRVLSLCRQSDALVVAATNRYQTDMLRDVLRACGLPTLLVSLGSPYLLEEVPTVDAYLAAYSFRYSAALAVARFLAGETQAPGTLPVSLPGLYPLGHSSAKPYLKLRERLKMTRGPKLPRSASRTALLLQH